MLIILPSICSLLSFFCSCLFSKLAIGKDMTFHQGINMYLDYIVNRTIHYRQVMNLASGQSRLFQIIVKKHIFNNCVKLIIFHIIILKRKSIPFTPYEYSVPPYFLFFHFDYFTDMIKLSKRTIRIKNHQ